MNRKALIALVLAVIAAIGGVTVATTDAWADKPTRTGNDDSGLSARHLGF